MEARKKKNRKQGTGGINQAKKVAEAHRSGWEAGRCSAFDSATGVLRKHAEAYYDQAQDLALAWFIKCKDGLNDFSGAKRQVDDALMKQLCLKHAIIEIERIDTNPILNEGSAKVGL